MTNAARAFRGFRFSAEVILWAVRWYLQFPISYRDLEHMLADRRVVHVHVKGVAAPEVAQFGNLGVAPVMMFVGALALVAAEPTSCERAWADQARSCDLGEWIAEPRGASRCPIV